MNTDSDPIRASVQVTDHARSVLETVQDEQGERVVVVLNDGCCDGMGPVAIAESLLGVNDMLVGSDKGFDIYAPHTRAQLREGYDVEIDVVEPVDATAFSLEVPYGYRLITAEARADTDV